MNITKEEICRVFTRSTGFDPTGEEDLPLVSILDSLDVLELILNLENHFQIQIEDDKAIECKTFNDLVVFILDPEITKRNPPHA